AECPGRLPRHRRDAPCPRYPGAGSARRWDRTAESSRGLLRVVGHRQRRDAIEAAAGPRQGEERLEIEEIAHEDPDIALEAQGPALDHRHQVVMPRWRQLLPELRP